MPIYAEKICHMRTLLKYAKNAATCEYAAITYLHKTDMPIFNGDVARTPFVNAECRCTLICTCSHLDSFHHKCICFINLM